MSSKSISGRYTYLDNIRLFMVLMVIILHGAAAYSNLLPWWSVQEPAKSRILDILVLFTDGFQLPVLYFIAGFFAYFSLNSKKHSAFLGSKLKRLGLPFLIIGIFFVPFISYMGHINFYPNPLGFLEFWIAQMKTILDFNFIHFKDMETGAKYALNYSPWHLWFISLLLLFYSIYAGFDFLKKKITGPQADHKVIPDKKPTGKSMVMVLFVSGTLIALAIAGTSMIFFDWSWATFSGLFLFQPTRVPLYAGLFALGVYTGSKEWFINYSLPGKPWLWGISSLIFSFVLILCMLGMFQSIGNGPLNPSPPGIAIIHGFGRSFLCIATIGFAVTFGHKYWNKSSEIIENISGLSYEIYLLHLPIVVLMQFAVSQLALPILIKFLIVLTTAVILCWSIGRLLFKPRPKWAAAAAIAMFIIAVFLIR